MPGIFIDIHTHNDLPNRADVISIKNMSVLEFTDKELDARLYSIGQHPWDSLGPILDPGRLMVLLVRPDIVAVGEIGIDRLKGGTIELQTALFKFQALLSQVYHAPVIIHCVKAWADIILAKKDIKPKVPWIIHGFRGSPQLAAQLVRQGFFLSFGESLLNMKSSSREAFKNTPDNRIFLETDESKHPIQEIYQAAAEIKNVSLVGLQNCITHNFAKVFGIHGTSRVASTN